MMMYQAICVKSGDVKYVAAHNRFTPAEPEAKAKNYVETKPEPMSLLAMKAIIQYLSMLKRHQLSESTKGSKLIQLAEKSAPFHMSYLRIKHDSILVDNYFNLLGGEALWAKCKEMYNQKRVPYVKSLYPQSTESLPEGVIFKAGALYFHDDICESMDKVEKFIEPKSFPVEYMHVFPDDPMDPIFDRKDLEKWTQTLHIVLPRARFGRGEWHEALPKLQHRNVYLIDNDISVYDFLVVAQNFVHRMKPMGYRFTVATWDVKQYMWGAKDGLQAKEGVLPWQMTPRSSSVFDRLCLTLPSSQMFTEVNVFITNHPSYDEERKLPDSILYGVTIEVMTKGTAQSID